MTSVHCTCFVPIFSLVLCEASTYFVWELALLLSRSVSFAWRLSSFLSWSSFSLTWELCCRSCPLRSVSKRFASFSKSDSSMERNCALWAPGTSPFLALLAITFARSASTCAKRSLRFFSK